MQLQREVAAAGEALAVSQAAVVAAAASGGEKEAALQGRLKEVEGVLAVEAAGKADAEARAAAASLGKADADARILQLQEEVAAAGEVLWQLN